MMTEAERMAIIQLLFFFVVVVYYFCTQNVEYFFIFIR